MREQVELREYDQRDLEPMVKLDEACFAPPFRFSRIAMRRFAEAENAWVTVAERDGEMVGFCIVHREKDGSEDLGYVVTIDVTEGSRGEGIGERMLSGGEAWVRSWQGAGMLLHVFAGNEGAVKFYERMGYERAEVQRGFYGPGLDAVLYWKDLLR